MLSLRGGEKTPHRFIDAPYHKGEHPKKDSNAAKNFEDRKEGEHQHNQESDAYGFYEFHYGKAPHELPVHTPAKGTYIKFRHTLIRYDVRDHRLVAILV